MDPVQRRESGPRRAPSIDDVARLAGVSAQTVSRVSRGSDKVRESTRERVLVAMRQLGYVPNRAARALRNGSYHVIGVLTQRVEQTGEAHTLSGVLDAARARELTVTVTQVNHPEAEEVHDAVADLIRQPVEGLVIVQSGLATAEHLALPPGLPVASSDSQLVGSYPSASADQVGGVRSAIEHLISLGHRRILHIRGPEDSPSASVRNAAWAHSLKQHGLDVPGPIRGGWSAVDGYRAGAAVMKDTKATAVFCANDEVATGLIRALQERGRRVPEDISVVGFDGLPMGEYLSPPLTTVQLDFRRAGATMVDLVVEQIEDGVRDGSRHVVIPTKLVLRGSTAAPPRFSAQ